MFSFKSNNVKNVVMNNQLNEQFSNTGTFYYSLDQSNLPSDYYGINSNGEIYVKRDITSLGTLGASLTFTATATDTGGKTDTAAISIVIPITTTIATTTTTDRYKV